jgi:phage shock protein A
MSLNLFDRIATLVKADAHGVVESLEERSLLLKQYLREAELELRRKRAELEFLAEREKQLRELLARREEENRSLDDDITLALAGGKDDLARFAIRRLLPRRAEAKALAARLADVVESSRATAERLAEQERQFEALKLRARAETLRVAEPECAAAWACEPSVADEEVELELLRRRRATEGGAPCAD